MGVGSAAVRHWLPVLLFGVSGAVLVASAVRGLHRWRVRRGQRKPVTVWLPLSAHIGGLLLAAIVVAVGLGGLLWLALGGPRVGGLPSAPSTGSGAGAPVRGRNAAGRADACWVPVAPNLTPHGLRHTYKTMMLELGTLPVVMDEQMGHEDGSIQGRYSHATPEMRRRLLDGLTDLWRSALEVRRGVHAGSPVAVLDRLLREESTS